MLELRFVRENLDLVRKKSLLRGVAAQLLDQFSETDNRRLALLTEVEALKNRRNTVSKTIAALKQTGEEGKAEPMIDRKSTRLNSSHSDRSRMPSSA